MRKDLQDHSKVREWIAQNIAELARPDDLEAALISNGYSREEATKVVSSVREEAGTRVAAEFAYKWRKTQALLEILLQRTEESDTNPILCSVEASEATDSVRKCLFANRPALLRRLVADWPAVASWTWAKLARRFGHYSVEVGRARMPEVGYSADIFDTFTTMRFGEFLAGVSNEDEYPFYLLARNRLLQHECFCELNAEISPIPGITDDPSSRARAPMLWIGPKSSLTSLHHDDCDALLAQVVGSKRVALVSPRYSKQVDTDRYCFSSFRQRPDELFDTLSELPVEVHLVDLKPGDVLLIPVGWWHAVEALSPSISVTIQGVNNGTRWDQPYLGERASLPAALRPPIYDASTYARFPDVR